MTQYVRSFSDIDRDALAIVGGKGAHLGELSRLRDIRVPDGFCVTTHAFSQHIADASPSQHLIGQLSQAGLSDHAAIRSISDELRAAIVSEPVSPGTTDAINRAHAQLGAHHAYAIRSSATAEDLPAMSFAGQHDSYLNIIGLDDIVQHVRQCWAALFTERAVLYRLRHGISQSDVKMAVVVQHMVQAQISGVLFTANPLTGHRKQPRVEAGFGLGEALVGGAVNPEANALTEAQRTKLLQLGRRIETHFGSPQDIEWVLANDTFHIVQSRPITTLFPIPAAGDGSNRVFVSVGHQQMMTDAMKPLGLSVWQLKAGRPMHEAGGRMFVDVTDALETPASRAALLGGLGKSDQLIGDALQTLFERGDFIETRSDEVMTERAHTLPIPVPIETDPALVARLIARDSAALQTSQARIDDKSGTELLDAILADIADLKHSLFDSTSMQVIYAAIQAAWWLNEHVETWLGDKNAADTLAQSVAGNITSEMGLALLDVADVIRPHRDVVGFLERTDNPQFMNQLPGIAGGREAHDALRAWLDRYGVRGVGEIDITRPRFRERPDMLLPMLLGNVRHMAHGAGAQRFAQGLQHAQQYEQQLLERLRALPEGEQKATDTKRMIERLRTFAGYREYPKYAMVSRTFVYKQALLDEAQRLVHAGVLSAREDIFLLRFEELHDVVQAQRLDPALLRARKDAFRLHRTLTPPRVITSDGECITGAYRREGLPEGALSGLPVSPGMIEGRARVIVDLTLAHLEPGDILVTTFTDPSWTPLFLSISGLVTEVGGLTTHGAVIAREYGLPAIVGVDRAAERIRDGQQIRLHATDGYVVVLTENAHHANVPA